MKIVIPTFERIEWMPPTIYLLEQLADMGHEVVYITVYPDGFFRDRRTDGRIRNVSLWKKDLTLQTRLPYVKGVSGLLMRLDEQVKRLISTRLGKVIDREMSDDALLWVVNEMTVMLAGSQFLKGREYAFTVYELHEKTRKNRCIEKAAKGAKLVVVPEYCRAHIMQSRYGLKKLPVVLPNKTAICFGDGPLSEAAQTAIELLDRHRRSGLTTVLYMGGIGGERPLEPILDAIQNDRRFRLVVMGRETAYLRMLQEKYPGQFDYLGGFRPPEHIRVAEHAGIGLLMYVSLNQMQGLNALFCAPNKLYEYTGRGLPVIANDIPGLRFPVLMNGVGCVADFGNSQSVIQALECIQADYHGYAQRAKAFYESVQTESIIQDIIANIR